MQCVREAGARTSGRLRATLSALQRAPDRSPILLQEESLAERTQIDATGFSTAALRIRGHLRGTSIWRGARLQHYCSSAYGRIARGCPYEGTWCSFSAIWFLSGYGLWEILMIFWRSVLRYLGADLTHHAVSILAEGLRRGGTPCVGASERLPSPIVESGKE
jgi:chemotaxis methyl-accepting protein methylase